MNTSLRDQKIQEIRRQLRELKAVAVDLQKPLKHSSSLSRLEIRRVKSQLLKTWEAVKRHEKNLQKLGVRLDG
jgi:hypothetical protein